MPLHRIKDPLARLSPVTMEEIRLATKQNRTAEEQAQLEKIWKDKRDAEAAEIRRNPFKTNFHDL